MNVEIVVPVVFFLSLVSIVVAWLYFGHKNKVVTQATIRRLAESGTQLSPDLVEKMLQTRAGYRDAPDVDLRRGIVLIALGLACFLAALFMEEDAVNWATFGAFPFMIGLGFVISSKVLRDKTLDEAD